MMVGVEKLEETYPASPSGQHRPDQHTVTAACSSRGNIDGYGMSRSRFDIPQNPRNAPLRAPPAPKLTNFFIEDILHPDFGSKRERKPDIEAARNDTDCSHNVTSNEGRTRGGSVSSSEEGMPSPGAPENTSGSKVNLWPAWVYCTRYSDRPSAGPRSRKTKKREKKQEEKRPRTAFTNEQLSCLRHEFDTNRYLTEQRRQELSRELKLNESQIKIWFQNKRAKLKKAGGITRSTLALHLMAQGLYNHAANSGDER